MQPELQLAIIALIVSLIALLIATGQLLQQILGTATGYRKCSESVIGPWHILRRRRIKWSELRLEVEYYTPHLVLITDESDMRRLRKLYEAVHTLSGTEDLEDDRRCQAMQLALKETFQLHWPEDDDDSDSCPYAVPETLDPEKQVQHLKREPGSKATGRHSKILVTWLRLLRDTHQRYATYKTYEQSSLTPSNLCPEGDPRPQRTEFAVAFKRRTWDLMPSDLIRPLATSNLRDILIVAIRLNMRWRELDLKDGRFLADGNGYTLSSVDVKSLGIVFQLAIDGPHDACVDYVPSLAAEKMMFGIVPGCRILVRQDYAFVQDDAATEALSPREILVSLGIDDKQLLDQMTEKALSEPHNDLVILLSPFLPLPGSSLFRGRLSAWSGSVTSVMASRDGRRALLHGLEERIDALTGHPKTQATLEWVYRELNTLQQDYPHDFACRHEASILGGGASQIQKLKLIDRCRQLFIDARYCFEGQNPGTYNWSKEAFGRTRFVDLIAAHVVMTFYAVQTALEKYDQTRGFSATEMQTHYGFKHPLPPDFDHQRYSIGKEYVQRLSERKFDVVSCLRRKGIGGVSDEEIEAAWWVLMLRGIAWCMSMAAGSGSGEDWWEGKKIPSSWYTIRTPIWIT